MSKKTVTVRVEPELYYLISLAAAKEKKSINEYVIDLLKKACSDE
jgi:predicted HicB family RNase H-like nuclease